MGWDQRDPSRLGVSLPDVPSVEVTRRRCSVLMGKAVVVLAQGASWLGDTHKQVWQAPGAGPSPA